MSRVNIKGTIRLEYGHHSELKYSAIPVLLRAFYQKGSEIYMNSPIIPQTALPPDKHSDINCSFHVKNHRVITCIIGTHLCQSFLIEPQATQHLRLQSCLLCGILVLRRFQFIQNRVIPHDPSRIRWYFVSRFSKNL